MLLNINTEQAITIIAPIVQRRWHFLVPKNFPAANNSQYRPEYDWLFLYERKLMRSLNPWVANYRHDLIGGKGLLTEALSNAYKHGHNSDPGQTIKVTILIGKKGLLISVEDFGKGFDVSTVLQQFHSGQRYYTVAGNGLRRMHDHQDFGIFYGPSGNIWSILYVNQGLSKLPSKMLKPL